MNLTRAFLSLCLLPSLPVLAQSARDPIPINEIMPPPGASAKPTPGKAQPAARPAAKPAPRPAPTRVVQPTRPRLVVLLVADQFRWDFITRYSKDFDKGGFRRLLGEGAVFQGHYDQQNTYTGPGHALIATGSYGYINGIIQNKWYNRATGRSEGMLFDPDARFLAGETTLDDESSPRNLIGTTLGDELRLAAPSSKVITLALKERGAIAMGGHLGQAYFQSETTGEMISSTYYMKELPEWVKTFNGRKLAEAAFGQTWDRLLPVERYGEDDAFKFENGGKGIGQTFPRKLTAKLEAPGPDFYTLFQQTPQGTDYTFEFAKAALEGEKLGKRGATDVLGISISTTDLAGHSFGPYSQEVHDLVVRLDRSLATFLTELDKRFLPGEVLVVFTADHGAVPIPEWSDEQGLDATRLKKAKIKEVLNKALSDAFGAGEWVVALEDPSVYLDRNLIASRKLDPAQVERVAGEAALSLPGIIGYHTRTQLTNGWLPPTRVAQAVARSFSQVRSGDVVLVQGPFSFWGKYAEKDVGTSHGSPFHYDTDVPLIFVGAPFQPGYYGETGMVDLAATMARVLGITPPAACEGRPLEEALK